MSVNKVQDDAATHTSDTMAAAVVQLERPGNHFTADDGNHSNSGNHGDQSSRKTSRDDERSITAGDQLTTVTHGAAWSERAACAHAPHVFLSLSLSLWLPVSRTDTEGRDSPPPLASPSSESQSSHVPHDLRVQRMLCSPS